MNDQYTRLRTRLLAIALLVGAQCALLTPNAQAQRLYYGQVQSYSSTEHETFFKRHPYAAAAGLGALTGGIGSLFLGGTLLHGAAVGAGSHSGFHFLKEKWQQRHSRY
jgi:hypothetical protein